jgi:hypothetical protein
MEKHSYVDVLAKFDGNQEFAIFVAFRARKSQRPQLELVSFVVDEAPLIAVGPSFDPRQEQQAEEYWHELTDQDLHSPFQSQAVPLYHQCGAAQLVDSGGSFLFQREAQMHMVQLYLVQDPHQTSLQLSLQPGTVHSQRLPVALKPNSDLQLAVCKYLSHRSLQSFPACGQQVKRTKRLQNFQVVPRISHAALMRATLPHDCQQAAWDRPWRKAPSSISGNCPHPLANETPYFHCALQ